MLTGLATSILTILKTWCARAARSPLTIVFLLAVLANYAVQTTIHGMILSYYTRNRELVSSAIDAFGVQRGFAVVQQDFLEICSGIPFVHGTRCYTVYNGSAISAPTGAPGVQCAEGWIWLENYLINSKSEEILYLVLESWLVVISLIALMDESIPHLIVVLAAQFVNTAWISYRIARDIAANRTYEKMVVAGTCGGFDILAGTWQYDMFYVTLGCSVVVLLGMFVLVSKLIKLYSKSKLSRVGSSLVMNRMLKWRLWMRVFLQFTTFFTISSAAIWYNKRKSIPRTSYSSSNSMENLFDAGFYVMAIITLPWLALGTQSISRESRLLFLIYAILSTVLLVISGLWFGSALYRYEFWDWRTFSCVTTMADILLIITCFLSLICRLNFGHGLAHFLVVERNLQAAGFAYDTFLNDPSSGWEWCDDMKQVMTANHLRSLSQPAPHNPHSESGPESSFNTTSKHSPSVCSIETTVFATWLAYMARGDLEKRNSPPGKEGKPGSTVLISRKDMSLHDSQSISDDGTNSPGGVDEKQMIVS